MKNPAETIGNLIDKQSVSFISSIDENGYPNTKAMLPPCKREGIKAFYWHTNSPSYNIEIHGGKRQISQQFSLRGF